MPEFYQPVITPRQRVILGVGGLALLAFVLWYVAHQLGGGCATAPTAVYSD